MAQSARLFIDFWNFQLNWNDRVGQVNRCDWKRLPAEILTATKKVHEDSGLSDDLELDETLVYASVDPTSEKGRNMKGWLDNFLDRQPSFRVVTKDRSPRPFPMHCSDCGQETKDCPHCGTTYTRSVEKGVDTQIVTDLLSLAWQDAFDVAVLLSSDADFVPAVIRVQEKGLKVVNASWSGHGHELKRKCWASFDLDTISGGLIRPPA